MNDETNNSLNENNPSCENQKNKQNENRNYTKGRLISMLVLAISFSVAQSVLIALVAGQVLFGLFAKEQNNALKKLAKQLTDYMYETLSYLTFNTEERPFPYRGWDETREHHVVVTD